MKQKSKKTAESAISRIFVFVATLTLLFLIIGARQEVLKRQYYGYLGIFVINFISNATVFFPLPAVVSVFLSGAVLEPVAIALVSGLGATLGELFSYLVGYGGRGLIGVLERKNHWLKKVEHFFHRAGFFTILLYSALPLPFFDFIGILSGAVDYPLWKFAVATLIGRILRNFLIAWTGAKILPI